MYKILDYLFPSSEPAPETPFQYMIDGLFFLLFFLTPIFISVSLKQVFNAPKYLFIGFVAGLLVSTWLLSAIRKREISFPRHKTFLFFSILVVWEFLTIYRSTGVALSLREYSIQLALFLVSLVAVINIRDRERIENLLHFAVAAGVIAASFGLLQYYKFDEYLFKGITQLTNGFVNLDFLVLPQKPENLVKIYSTMGHRNYLAGYLICILPFVLSRLISSLSIFLDKGIYSSIALRQAIVYGLSCVIMFSVVVLTHTRGSWIGLSCGILCFVFLLYFKFRGLGTSGPLVISGMSAFSLMCLLGSENAIGALLVVILTIAFVFKIVASPHTRLIPLVVLFLFLSAVIFQGTGKLLPSSNPMVKMKEGALKRLSNSFDLRHGSAFQRVLIWRTALWIILDNPKNFFFGTGFGTFGLNYMPSQAKVLADPRYEEFMKEVNKSIYAHSEYLHFFSEIGLIGILLMLCTAGTFVYSMFIYISRMRPTHQNLLLIGMLSSTVAVLCHNMFSFSLHLPYTSSLFYCLVAFCLRFAGLQEYRVSWGGTPQSEGEVEIGDGVLSAGLHRYGKNNYRAWAQWLIEPSSLTDLSTISATVNSNRKSVNSFSDFERHLSSPVILDGKGSDQGEVFEVKDGEQVILSLSNRSDEPDSSTVIGETTAIIIVLVLLGMVVSSVRDSIYMDMYWRNGFLKFKGRHFEEAIVDYKRALALQPTRGEVLFDFGRTLMDSNRNYEAIKQFEKAKANFVDPANDHNIALCYYKEKQLEKAEKYYRKALELNPIYEQSLANLAYYLVTHGRADEARAFLEKGVKYYPRNGQFLASAGVLSAKLGEFDKATEYLTKSLEYMPSNRSARVNLATILFNQKKYEEAVDHFKALYEEQPDDLIVARKYFGARVLIIRPKLENSPDDEKLLLELVQVYVKLGELGVPEYSHEAVRILRRYLKQIPQSGEGRYYLAKALGQLGFNEEALTEANASAALLGQFSSLKPLAENLARILKLKSSGKQGGR